MNDNARMIKSWQTHLFFHGSHRGNGLVCEMNCKFRKLYPVPSEIIEKAVQEKIIQQQFLPLDKEIEKNVDYWIIFNNKP